MELPKRNSFHLLIAVLRAIARRERTESWSEGVPGLALSPPSLPPEPRRPGRGSLHFAPGRWYGRPLEAPESGGGSSKLSWYRSRNRSHAVQLGHWLHFSHVKPGIVHVGQPLSLGTLTMAVVLFVLISF